MPKSTMARVIAGMTCGPCSSTAAKFWNPALTCALTFRGPSSCRSSAICDDGQVRYPRALILSILMCRILMAQEETPDKRLQRSTQTIHEIAATPDKGIPLGLLEKAQCIVIQPGMIQATFLVVG